MDNVLYDDISFLAEIYSLEDMSFEIAKENVKYVHAYQTIGNQSILVEGFTDAIDKIGNFFKMMIEKIRAFFKKIFAYIDACFMDIDKFRKKYKTELDKINNVDFDVNGFEWTMHDAPNLDPFNDLVSGYNDALSNFEKVKKDDIKREQNEFLTDKNLAELRGKILGSNDAISEDDWHESIRKYYRNGELDAQKIHVDTTMYRDCVASAPQLSKFKKESEKTRDDLIMLLDKTQRFFDQKASSVYVSGTKKLRASSLNVKDGEFHKGEENYLKYSDSSASTLETLIRFKYTQASKLASMINLVATERANAYKDQVKMTREIIKGALFKSSDDIDKNE